jgi:hypothetical protein
MTAQEHADRIKKNADDFWFDRVDYETFKATARLLWDSVPSEISRDVARILAPPMHA